MERLLPGELAKEFDMTKKGATDHQELANFLLVV
jgi:hypothetical protein